MSNSNTVNPWTIATVLIVLGGLSGVVKIKEWSDKREMLRQAERMNYVMPPYQPSQAAPPPQHVEMPVAPTYAPEPAYAQPPVAYVPEPSYSPPPTYSSPEPRSTPQAPIYPTAPSGPSQADIQRRMELQQQQQARAMKKSQADLMRQQADNLLKQS